MVETGGRTSSGRAFRAGLTSPSLASLFGAVVVAAGLFLLAMVHVTPGRVGTFGWRFGWDRDRHPRLASTIRTLALRHEPPSPGSVVLLGASDLRSLLVSDEFLAAEIERRTGRRPEIRNLALPGASVWSTLASLDHVPEGFSGVLVFTTNPERLTASPEQLQSDYGEPTLGLTSPLLDDEAVRAGVQVPRRGNWFVDHLAFYGKYGVTLIGLTLEGSGPRGTGRPRQPGPWRTEDRQRAEMKVSRWLAGYEESAPANLARIARAFTRIRARTDARILLLETPRRPDWAPAFYGEKLLSTHRALVREFAGKAGADYFDLDGALDLDPEDFADHCHLRSEAGRRKATTLLAARIAEILEEDR
jgi:hypothetical protein